MYQFLLQEIGITKQVLAKAHLNTNVCAQSAATRAAKTWQTARSAL